MWAPWQRKVLSLCSRRYSVFSQFGITVLGIWFGIVRVRRWAVAIAVLVALSIVITTVIAYEAKFYNAHDFAFRIKLSLTIPLGFAITFCTIQYSRERRLEEEYAFKASISRSR